MKEKFEKAEIEVIRFEDEINTIIRTSQVHTPVMDETTGSL